MKRPLAMQDGFVPHSARSQAFVRVKHIVGVLVLALPNLSDAGPLAERVLRPVKHLARQAANATTSVLTDFQVYPPVLTPLTDGFGLTNGSADNGEVPVPTPANSTCVTQQTLMEYSFANSYGMPFVGPYAPPADCAFNRVTFNLTVTAAGRQFDRLGIVYFGSTEIWRTSTAEPTAAGIVWTYIKDMSHLLALLTEPQTLIFDLGNIVDSTYTAPFNATLIATFFSSEDTVEPADQILTVSGGNGTADQASVFTVPPQNASSSLTLPQNVNKAVFSVAATGQIDEEFWYTNVLNSQVLTFNQSGTQLLGYGPFREVQLYIDGTLAGVVFPFPIIFTGGIVPGFWRPIVGIDAFDLREDEIDITPWLGLLCDGNPHTFEVLIAGINDDGNGNGEISTSVGSYWLVTGKVFLWLDPEGSITTGAAPTVNAPPPAIQLNSTIGTTTNGTNSSLTVDVNVQRQLSVRSTIQTANGTISPSWSQSLSYSNHDEITNFGVTQYTTQTSSGTDSAPLRPYVRTIGYPITVNSTFEETDTALSITAVLTRGENIQIAGSPVFPTGLQSFDALPALSNNTGPQFQGTLLQTTQNGSAYYLNSLAANISSGTTTQDLSFTGIRLDNYGDGGFPPISGSEELYSREVTAVNATVVSDQESIVGQSLPSTNNGPEIGPVAQDAWAGPNPMKVLGRGPGSNAVGTPPA